MERREGAGAVALNDPLLHPLLNRAGAVVVEWGVLVIPISTLP